jgi:hypothetical protein
LLPPPNDVTLYAYQPDNTVAINNYQNDDIFYAYQPPPLLNDVHIDAYQPNNSDQCLSGVKKMKLVFFKTTSQSGCGLSG